ncbi:hypothetical protein ACIRPK_36300 [Kitasatospora sp. NPDC101801]|uniref:hypothetical protein n=1 Tax=Kitasatospora sp. NPDC101801 TaxID=3364103 RepID=UPI00382FFD88
MTSMTAPHLPLGLWWIVAIVSVLSFLVFMTSLMPSRAYKVQVAVAPLLVAVTLAVLGFLEDFGAAQLVAMYACVITGLQVAFVGRRREMRQLMADTLARDAGEDVSPGLSMSANIQVVGVCLVAVAAAVWFSFAS